MKTKTSLFLKSSKNLAISVIALAVSIFLVFSLIVVLGSAFNIEKYYDLFIDPIIAILTAIIALGLWFFQNYKNWKESLPKRLTVHFMYNGKCQLSCYEAFLSGTADIRMWSQQIGFQMIGHQNLSFYPYIDNKPARIMASHEIHETSKSETIMVYEVTFYLRDNEFSKRPDIKDKYIIWLDNSTKTGSENLELIIDEQPKLPFSVDEAIQALEVKEKADNKREAINL